MQRVDQPVSSLQSELSLLSAGALHTESRRRFRREWLAAGGTIEDVHRTGEERYRHPLCAHPIRTNKRRKDVPAKLLSCINAIHRHLATARA